MEKHDQKDTWSRTVTEIKQILIVTEQKTHPWFLQRQKKKKKKNQKSDDL